MIFGVNDHIRANDRRIIEHSSVDRNPSFDLILGATLRSHTTCCRNPTAIQPDNNDLLRSKVMGAEECDAVRVNDVNIIFIDLLGCGPVMVFIEVGVCYNIS